MKKILLLAFTLFSSGIANAQIPAVAILQNTVDKIHSLNTLSYDYKAVDKNPFSAGDTSFTSTKSTIIFNADGRIKASCEKTSINNGQSQLITALKNDTIFSVDLVDSTYSLTIHPDSNTGNPELISIINIIRQNLRTPSKIFQKRDTLIDNIACHNLIIMAYDSIENGLHNYTYYNIAIAKATALPVLFVEHGLGTTEKDGHVIGRLSFYNFGHFYNLQTDKAIKEPLFYFDKAKFSLANDKMLTAGTSAPGLNLIDLSNKPVPAAGLKNKLLLIEFGATVCGANPLANPLLNRLNKKYAGKDFTIVSIYTNETAEQVSKYVESNKLQFPVYLGSLKQKKAFKTVGTPNFYLVDKDGKIAGAYEGYYDDLEKDLEKMIDSALSINP